MTEVNPGKNMGLKKSEHIAKYVDPRNSDIVFVAVRTLWGPGGDRVFTNPLMEEKHEGSATHQRKHWCYRCDHRSKKS